jgi:beta-phosphoglucomutase
MSNNLSEIEVVIFDMDGVLFLSSDCHERAFREVLQKIGITDFAYASVAGMRTEETIEKILIENGRLVSLETVQELANAKRKRALEFLGKEGEITPQSKELIASLRKKYRLVLASSASPQTVELFLQKSGYSDAFKLCLNGAMVKEAKPSPEIYLLAAKRLDIEPKGCIVVEDAINGVEAAKKAGMLAVAVLGTEVPEKLLAAGADYLIKNLAEIEPILLTRPI